MRTDRQQPRGSAIFLAMVMVVGALALLMGVLTISTQNVTKHEQYSDREKSFLAAQGMLKTVFSDIFSPMSNPNGSSTNQLGAYFIPAVPPAVVPGVWSQGNFFTWFGAPDGPWAAPGLIVNPPYTARKIGDCYITDVSTRWHISSKNTGAVATSPVYRFFLSIRVTAQRTPPGQFNADGTPFHLPGDVPSVVMETYELNQDSQSPLAKYVELAKNVSCSLCHTSFDNVYNYFNKDAFAKLSDPSNTHSTVAGVNEAKAKFGTFGRAKVASLGNFQMRGNSGSPSDHGRFFPSDAVVEGTFYSRGSVQDQFGNPLTNIDPVAMQSVEFGTANTADTNAGINIYQDPNSAPVPGMESLVPMVAATMDSTGTPVSANVSSAGKAAPANLYLNYPTDTTKMSDGQVPLDFPFPFADVSNNKLVTDDAVSAKLTLNAGNAAAKASTPNITGGISGGLAMVVLKGNQFTSKTLPVATYQADGVTPTDNRLSDSSAVHNKGVVDGNLILIGTKDNPVNIDQQTIVKGDIIIKGYYTGVGSLWAQGNIYLPSDLQYKNVPLTDATGKVLADKNGLPLENFGVAPGTHAVTDAFGTTTHPNNENLGGLIAGGTIIVGDYLTASVSESGKNPDGTTRHYKNPDGTDSTNLMQYPDLSPQQRSGYVNNQPPDAASAYGDPYARENGFPLVPTYQRTDPTVTYNYFQLNSTTGKYAPTPTPLFTTNFTVSQLEIFNRDQWAASQPSVLPASDGTFKANLNYNDPSMPGIVPRYYVLNRGDPVNAFVTGRQSTLPAPSDPNYAAISTAQAAQQLMDVSARKQTPSGAGGTYWDDTNKSFMGAENSKLYDNITIGGATKDWSYVPLNLPAVNLPAGTGGVINGTPTHLVYAPADPTKPAGSYTDPVTLQTGWNTDQSQLVDSTDATKKQKAAVIALNPDWIPTDKMWSVLLNEEWSRKAHDTSSQAVYMSKNDVTTLGGAAAAVTATSRDGSPFRIDGMLYTNNAIFGIQRNRTLAPQAAGDYQNAVDASGNPYTPDPTQPGPWQTLPPDVSSTHDYYQVTELQDVWSQTTKYDKYSFSNYTDHYTEVTHVDNYSRPVFTDHYSQAQHVDNYTRNKYVDTYKENQYVDNYQRTVFTDHYQEQTHVDNYTRQQFTDHYTQAQMKDNYSRTPLTDNYNQTQYVDHYSKTTTTDVYKQTPYTQTTRSWHCNKSTAYGDVYVGDVQQTNPPTTFSQPTVCGGFPVSSATYTDASTLISPSGTTSVIEPAGPPAGYTVLVSSTPVTTTAVSAMYTGAAPAVPAGFTKTSTTNTVATSSSSPYYGAPAPAVPAGWSKVGTTTGAVQTSQSATYTTTAPAVPTPGWAITSTTTTVATSNSAAYLTGAQPAAPAGWALSSTTSVTQTSTSGSYTTTAPAVPAGYTVASTTTTTATSASAGYFGPPAPALPAGWTFVNTTTATQTSTSAVYTGTPPAPPAGWTVTSTTTTTVTSNTAAYYTTPTPNPGLALAAPWVYVSTATTPQTSSSVTYTTPAPALPTPGWVVASTTNSTATSVSAVYYAAPAPALPAGWTFVNTTNTTATSSSAVYTTTAPAVPTPGWAVTSTTSGTSTATSATYVNPVSPPALPAGYTFVNTTSVASTSDSNIVYGGAGTYYNSSPAPAVPAGYTKTGTVSTTTTKTLPNAAPAYQDSGSYVYFKGNAAPAGPGGYVFSVTNTIRTTTIQWPLNSTPPSPSAVKQPPPASDTSYAYPTGTSAGKSASDFRQYAKEQESSSRGRLLINGAVMAPDLGLLVTGRPSAQYPKNLILNYDNRVVRLLQLPNTNKQPWQVLRVGWSRIDPDITQ